MNKAKLILKLNRDKNGWPPVDVESVWVDAKPDGLYEIANIPFYSSEVAFGDIVSATEAPDKSLELKSVVKSSGNSTVHFFVNSGFSAQRDVVLSLEKMEVQVELADDRYGAISVSKQLPYKKIRNELDSLQSKGVLSFQETLLRHIV